MSQCDWCGKEIRGSGVHDGGYYCSNSCRAKAAKDPKMMRQKQAQSAFGTVIVIFFCICVLVGIIAGIITKGTSPKTAAVEQTNSEANATMGSLKDARDNQVYKTVKIGNHIWMAQELNYKTDSSWEGYRGRLYTWDAAVKACPSGWHLPNNAEWDNLVQVAGGKDGAAKKLRSINDWGCWDPDDGNCNGEGTDDYGFSAQPGGYRNTADIFKGASYNGNWWSATEKGRDEAHDRSMSSSDDKVDAGTSRKGMAFSVRCVVGKSGANAQTTAPSAAATTASPPSGAFSADAAVTKEEWAILMQDADFKAADQRLGEAYKRATAAAAQKSDDSKQALTKEQRAWAAKRERDAFAHAGKGTMEYKRFFIDKGNERIAELQAYMGER